MYQVSYGERLHKEWTQTREQTRETLQNSSGLLYIPDMIKKAITLCFENNTHCMSFYFKLWTEKELFLNIDVSQVSAPDMSVMSVELLISKVTTALTETRELKKPSKIHHL